MDSDKSFVVLDRPAVPQEAASGTGWGAALGTGWGAAPGTGWDTWARHGEANLEDSRPMQDRPRAAGVDSSNRHYGNNWEAGQGWGDLPRQTQSAQVPPVAGGYPLPQPQYRSVPAPYQQHLNQQLEPLFVAVNPFQARGWRRPARTAQPEPGGSTGHLVWSVPPPQSIQPFVPAGDATNRPVWTAPPDQFIPPVIPAGDATSRPGWNILPHDFIPPVMPPWADDQAGHAPGAPPAPGPFWRTVPPMPVSSPPIVPDPTNQDSVEDPRPRLPQACARCKKLKVKCTFENETLSCRRCVIGGHDCIIPGRKQRGASPRHDRWAAQIREQAAQMQESEQELSELRERNRLAEQEDAGHSRRSLSPASHHRLSPSLHQDICDRRSSRSRSRSRRRPSTHENVEVSRSTSRHHSPPWPFPMVMKPRSRAGSARSRSRSPSTHRRGRPPPSLRHSPSPPIHQRYSPSPPIHQPPIIVPHGRSRSRSRSSRRRSSSPENVGVSNRYSPIPAPLPSRPTSTPLPAASDTELESIGSAPSWASSLAKPPSIAMSAVSMANSERRSRSRPRSRSPGPTRRSRLRSRRSPGRTRSSRSRSRSRSPGPTRRSRLRSRSRSPGPTRRSRSTSRSRSPRRACLSRSPPRREFRSTQYSYSRRSSPRRRHASFRHSRSASRFPKNQRISRSRSPRHHEYRHRSRSPRRSPSIPVYAPPNTTDWAQMTNPQWYPPMYGAAPHIVPTRLPAQGYAAYPPPKLIPYAFPPIPEKRFYMNAETLSTGLPPPATSSSGKSSSLQTAMLVVVLILFEFIPGQIYLHFLLRIPSLYFSRVTRIFEDARLSLPDIQRMARAKADQWNPSDDFIWQPSMQTRDQMPLPRSLLQFRSSWESFIDSLMREWKTFNIISVLLMSAILTMLQIEAASHPITRTSALLSLICSLMSLLYGCMYIIRFGSMRKMHKASSFAKEAQKRTNGIWWNIWVLLAMPAIWLAWSIVMFLTCIMSFIWLSGSSQDPVDFVVSPRTALGLRIGLTVVFFLGLIYFVLIVRTFHRYGDPLDREWMETVGQWTKQALDASQNPYNVPPPAAGPFYPSPRPATRRHSITPEFRHTRAKDSLDLFQTGSDAPLRSVGSSFPSRPGWRSITPERRPPPPTQVVMPSFLAREGSPSLRDDFTKLPPSSPLTTRPSAFFKTPHPAFPRPVEPSPVMHLGQPDVEGRTTAYANPMWADAIAADDWARFMLDVSSAWQGQLTLTPPDADAASTDFPAYTLLSPARPDNPIPTSAESDTSSVVHRSCERHRTSSSESSYSRPKPPKDMTAGLSTPKASAPDINNTEGDQNTFAQTLSASPAQPPASPTQLPADGVAPTTSHTEEQSDPAHDTAQTVREFIDLWNERYFHPRNLEASLELRPDSSGPVFAVNLASRSFAADDSSYYFATSGQARLR